MMAPVLAGFLAGALLVAIFAYAPNPQAARLIIPASAEEQDLIQKSNELDAVQAFMKKYPRAHVGIQNRDNFVVYNDQGDMTDAIPALTISYVSAPRTIFSIDEYRANQHLIRYENPSLWIVTALDGKVLDVTLRCGISYGEGTGFVDVIQGSDTAMQYLKRGFCQ